MKQVLCWHNSEKEKRISRHNTYNGSISGLLGGNVTKARTVMIVRIMMGRHVARNIFIIYVIAKAMYHSVYCYTVDNS